MMVTDDLYDLLEEDMISDNIELQEYLTRIASSAEEYLQTGKDDSLEEAVAELIRYLNR